MGSLSKVFAALLVALLATTCEPARADSGTSAGTMAGTRAATHTAATYGTVALFFDGLSANPNAAWSVNERLLTSYTGALCRIRRASDSTETDIGYGTNNLVDQSSMSTFCTGTNCYWKTFYDQSGNGRDMTQATAANQPQAWVTETGITLSGANVVAVFDGAGGGNGDFLAATTSLGITGSSTITLFQIGKLTNTSSTYGMMDVGIDGHDFALIATSSTNVKTWVDGDTGERTFTTSSLTSYHYDLVTVSGNSNTAAWRTNANALTASATTAHTNSITSGNPGAWIGIYRGLDGVAPMSFSTWAAWGSVLSGPDQTTLETRAEARRIL